MYGFISGFSVLLHWSFLMPCCVACCCSVAKSCPIVFSLRDYSTPRFPVLRYLPEFADSCPLSQWCYPNISSSVTPFSCLQSFPASGSFPVGQLFTSGGQSTGASASARPSNEYSGLISFRNDCVAYCHSIVTWNQEVWVLQFSSFSNWFDWIPCNSIWICRPVFPFMQKKCWNLDGYCIQYATVLDSVKICLPVHEYRMFFP